MFGELWTQQAVKVHCCQWKKAVNCKLTLWNIIHLEKLIIVMADITPFIHCDYSLPKLAFSNILCNVWLWWIRCIFITNSLNSCYQLSDT